MLDVEKLLKNKVNIFPASTKQDILILCPFHSDSNPSCSVQKETGIFQCWSCCETGNIYKLLAKVENISEEAVKERFSQEFSASVLVDDLQSQIISNVDIKHEKRKLKYLSEKALFEKFPELNEASINYLLFRKLNLSTIKKFNLRQGVELFKKNRKIKKWVNRIIIPFYNLQNKIVGFGGRTLNKNDKPKVKKYVTCEGIGKTFLFGLEHLWKGKKLKYLILGESDIDIMYLQQLGLNAVAGWAVSKLSDQQISIIVNTTEVLILNYNNRYIDEAGAKAILREERNMKPYLPTLILDFPKNVKDANELTVKEVYKVYNLFLRRYGLI